MTARHSGQAHAVSIRRTLAAGAVLAIVLTACGDDDADDDAPPPASEAAPPATTDPDPGPGPGPDGGEPGATVTTGLETGTGTAPAGADAWRAAITTAETDTGGVAFALDGERNGWEVTVAVGDRGLEVQLGASGTDVLGSTDDDPLDADDRAALAGTVTLADAIATALVEVPGALDSAEADSGPGGASVWEVTVVAADGRDVEVAVDVATGEVLLVERDD